MDDGDQVLNSVTETVPANQNAIRAVSSGLLGFTSPNQFQNVRDCFTVCGVNNMEDFRNGMADCFGVSPSCHSFRDAIQISDGPKFVATQNSTSGGIERGVGHIIFA